ncbi:hypothetical protein HYU14_01050 [Candidatus Woesearchaeota archaeon]|nr:hypothetical protein [Candidatus Woesearchaeota archaeon]
MKTKKAIAVQQLVLFILAAIVLLFIMWYIWNTRSDTEVVMEKLKQAFA